MKKIPLTQAKHALVDDEDYEHLTQWKWHVGRSRNTDKFCARRTDRTNGITYLFMHRVILKAPEDMEVDHIDGNPLNNQKSNLRLCTRTQNNQSRRMFRHNKSGYKGVWRNSKGKPWMACITVSGKVINLGYYTDRQEAARAYDKAARKYYDSFAVTNEMLGLLPI